MAWIDISRRLESDTPVWPGDTKFHFHLNWSIEKGSSVNVGNIMMSIHTGTHVDAPFHFDSHGKKIIEMPIETFIGPAYVIELPDKSCIRRSDLEDFDLDGVQRLIIKTNSWQDPNIFPNSITFLDADIAAYLAGKGIQLIGVDVPSIDPLTSKELAAHHQFHRYGIGILEGLWLEKVKQGHYELIALPLPIVEGDGSPVRAILRKIP